ncbi:MAG: hypothetical protein ABSA78_14905 [Candidatus Sulfotelmatobacter sp.]|jgi:hypothetical protein
MGSEQIVRIDLEEEERRIQPELEDWLPRLGDTLLISTGEAAFVDCTGATGWGEERSPVGRNSLYSSGYLLAADRLVESLLGAAFEDALIYPIFYLYRHHVELELKGSISLFLNWLHGGTSEERDKQLQKLTREHSIQALWDTLKSLAPQIAAQMPAAATEAFESLVQQINTHDGKSEAARYAFYRDGKQTLLGVDEVNLHNLRVQFHKVSHYLGAFKEAIHQEIDPEE